MGGGTTFGDLSPTVTPVSDLDTTYEDLLADLPIGAILRPADGGLGVAPGEAAMGDVSETLTDRYMLLQAGVATFGAMPSSFVYDGHNISKHAGYNKGIIKTNKFVDSYVYLTGRTGDYFRTYGFDKTTLFEFMTSTSFQNDIEEAFDESGWEGAITFVGEAITTAVEDFQGELSSKPDGVVLGCTAYYGYHFSDFSAASLASPDIMYSETITMTKSRLMHQMPMPNLDSPNYSGHSGDDRYTISGQVYQGGDFWNSSQPYGEPVKIRQKFGWTDPTLKRKNGCKEIIKDKISNIIDDLEQGVIQRMDISKTTNRLNVTRNMFEKIVDDGMTPIVDLISGKPNIASITSTYETGKGKLISSTTTTSTTGGGSTGGGGY